MLLLLFVISLLCNSPTSVPALNDEGVALMNFKRELGEDPERSTANWNESSENPCLWNGITCQEQIVVSLSIPNKNLRGSISPSLGSLFQLRHLNLRNNNLSGTLPADLFKIKGLQSIILTGNTLTGSIPGQIGNLTYLQALDLSQNSLEGPIPASLVHCRRLRTLDLSRNSFSSSLPKGFGSNLISLHELNLSFNKFIGGLPQDIGNLSSLEGTVDFSHNSFSGSIPGSLGELPEKVYIDLTYNNLTGAIPQNGALMNRGPTAFLGNPNLCGPPLKNQCESFPSLPTENTQKSRSRGLSKKALLIIIISDVIGILLVGVLFSFCYSRLCREEDDYSKRKKECFCIRKDESASVSEDNELVALDPAVNFNLDELLKASAFVLGKSGIGIVYRVVFDGLTLAVRRLGEGGSQRFKEFQSEVEVIGKLKHSNIVNLRAYYWSGDEKLLVYDYIPNGNLSTALHERGETTSFSPVQWPVRMRIIKGFAKGLAYLHEFSPKKYVHGDLNPNNVLLDENMEPRISDFGLGRLLGRDTDRVGFGSGYRAPEAGKGGKPSQKWDVYSYGVVLLEMVTGRGPIVRVGEAEVGIVRWIELCVEEKRQLGDVVDPYLVEDPVRDEEMIAVLKVALACASSSPEKRPAMRNVVEMLERSSSG